MNTNTIYKRLFIYISGLFLLALGATFSIIASIGVSPVTSLPYALSLITPLSVGITTILANICFVFVQALLLKEIRMNEYFLQLLIAFVFGFFMDFTIWLTNSLPDANSIWLIVLYFIIGLVIVGFGLLFYFTANLPTMPFDSLTHVIANKWEMKFSKAKITSDLLNVLFSLTLCLIFIHSFGAIGIGTFIAAYGIGKIVGALLHAFQPRLKEWVFNTDNDCIY